MSYGAVGGDRHDILKNVITFKNTAGMVPRIQGMFGPFLSAWEIIDQALYYIHAHLDGASNRQHDCATIQKPAEKGQASTRLT
jgi:hypothetical protein